MNERSKFKKSAFLPVLFGFVILLSVLIGFPEAGSAREEPFHKVIAIKNLLREDNQETILWHDYGAFALYLVTPYAWQELPEEIRSQVQLIDGMDTHQVGPDSSSVQQNAWAPDGEDEIENGERLQLIQFVGPIKDEWLREIEAAGIEPVHYVANYGYLVWAGESGQQNLNQLAQNGSFVQHSMPYRPSFKLGPTLSIKSKRESGGDDMVPVTIQLYRHEHVSESEQILKKILVDNPGPWEFVLNFQNIKGTIRREDIPLVAALPDVVWIGERFQRELDDEVQGQIMANNLSPGQNLPSGPGYLSWLSGLGLGSDPNNYPIVDITDDGIGNGLAADAAGDRTLREMGNDANPSRLAYIANCTSAANGGGPDGHGHINVSIAGGYDSRSAYPNRDSNGYQLGLGINPYGRFAGTRVFDGFFDISGCGGTDRSLIRETYQRGARIVSNSWGCSECAGVYDTSSQAFDASVRDADSTAAGNQELSILFSAGNSGSSANTIGTPGNGKNVITVGASENVRPTWTDGCGVGPSGADSVQDIAPFSSRGPAPGGRVKPDVVAPGTHVQGTASTSPFYNGSGVCDSYHPAGQTLFAASSGTSHSTPAVAGSASLVYAFLQQQYSLTAPSPALIKGYIIAHTMYLNGSGAGGDLPGFDQGYGIPDLGAAFANTSQVILDQDDVPRFDASGETWSLNVSAVDTTKPVRIVMTYTDQPGAVGTQPQVNDLDLSVQADGTNYLGNHLSGKWSTPGGMADKLNNVEAVFLPSLTDSSLRIKVTAFNIAGDGVPGVGDLTDQDFILVCSNCAEREDFALSVQPTSASICESGSAEFDVYLESVLGFSDSVTLDVAKVPAGVSSQFSKNPIVPADQSQLTLVVAESAAPGTYSMSVVGSSTDREHSADIELEIFSDVPAVPALLTPPDGTKDIPVDVQLSWTAVSQAGSYEIQIALDPDFDHVVEEKTGLSKNSYKTKDLQPGQLYYWRVRAVNTCSTSAFSTSNTFSTERLPGGCPPGVLTDVIYHSDFEDSAPGWSHNGNQDTWQLSSIRSHSESTSFYVMDVDRISDQRLISPAINLPSNRAFLTLQYWNYRDIEGNEGQSGVCFDGGILEISTNDGASWQQIGNRQNDRTLLTDPYDGIVDSNYLNPLSGRYAWCGDPQEWLNSVIQLDSFAGQTVRFRFRLASDISEGREGWYIDDVTVQGCEIDFKETYLPLVLGQ